MERKDSYSFRNWMDGVPKRNFRKVWRKVMDECNVEYYIVVNWRNSRCAILEDKKKAIIEQIAGAKIFRGGTVIMNEKHKETEKKRKGKVRENIKPLLLRGESEFAAAFGIFSNHTHAKLRDEGMPYYCHGKIFVYDPEDVLSWLKERWKPQMPTR